MAGDWLKMTHALPEKPEVLAIAGRTGMNRYEVVGRLFILWRWFDNNTVDGNAVGVTSVTLNECLFGYGGDTNFVAAVVAARWLVEDADGVSVVKFDEHTSESAKQRAQTAKRVAKSKKNAKGNAEDGEKVTHGALPGALPKEEKRREEKILKELAPQQAAKPTKRATRLPDDWRPDREYWEAAQLINKDLTQEWFVQVAHKFKDYWIAKSGKDATKADWLATWRNWIRREVENAKGGSGAAGKQSYGQQRSELFDAVTDYARATDF